MMSGYIHRNKSKSEIQSEIKPVDQTPPSYQHVKETRKANSVQSVQRISKFLFDIFFFFLEEQFSISKMLTINNSTTLVKK